MFGKQKTNEFSSSTSRTRFEPATNGYLHILHSKVLPPELPFRVMNCFDTIIQSISNLNESKNMSMAFDTDSVQIGVDNRTSYSMSNNENDFIGPIKPLCDHYIKGVGGKLAVHGIGTVLWKINDDNNKMHEIKIPGTLFVKDLEMRLLSPQHWCQVAEDNKPNPDGTICITLANKVILKWDQLQFQKTIWIDKGNNCFTFQTTEGISNYCKSCQLINEENNYDHKKSELCLMSCDTRMDQYLQNDEINNDGYEYEENLHDTLNIPTNVRNERKLFNEPYENLSAENLQAKLMRWHYRLGHTSFRKLKIMAAMGLIPKKLSTIKPPKCAACIYGTMNKLPWRYKQNLNQKQSKIKVANKSGQIVSVDQMDSSNLGFIAQLKGKLTRRRYKHATIFVDHYSDLSYVHLQETLSSNETVQAKHAFEAYARKYNVKLLHYHADNGRFADNLFINDVNIQGQTISYCGVGAHFQNGRAEKRIRDLRERARTMLIHASQRWPNAINVHLWPYALRTANEHINTLPKDIEGSTRIELFSGIQILTKFRNFHTWGCPVYSLHHKLQSNSGSGLPKWNPRAKLGINLGLSPRHASNITLVLKLDTGLVSPQFHVLHDDFFETIRDKNNLMESKWQQLSGLMTNRTRSIKSDVDFKSKENNTNNMDDNQQESNNKDSLVQQEENDNDEGENIQEYGSHFQDGVRRSHRIKAIVSNETYFDCMHEEDYKLQDDMTNPISFAASTDPDVMYWNQAMKQPDAKCFQEAAIKEFNDHTVRKHWKLIDRNAVPSSKNILQAVWAMRRKRDIKTRKIIKYKARLNIHGGQQIFGEDYYETYSPVITWMTIRFLLVVTMICGWKSIQIDFVLAFPQADIEQEMYMELPSGIQTKDPDKDYVLQLTKNLYGQKQASRVFYLHLKKGLEKIGFQPSQIDEGLFFRGTTIFVVYVDDGIFFDPSEDKIYQATKDLQNAGYDIEIKGTITDYLGVNFKYTDDGKIELTQPHLIDQIVEDSKILKKKFVPTSIPAKSSKILHRYENAEDFDNRWNYRSIIGRLNFLEKNTRPDIAYATHQCARFSHDPKQQHAEAVEYLIKYLHATKDKGIIMKPKGEPIIEIYADADFSGNWNKATASKDPSTAKSRTGYVVMFANCPIVWVSKLQTQVALSTTEAEYISLSQSLRDGIPLVQIVQELKDRNILNLNDKIKVHCRCYEDNAGALELSNVPKLRPRTKHINIVYHHFREHVRSGLVKVFPIGTSDQVADIMTKPLPQNLFQKFRKQLIGW